MRIFLTKICYRCKKKKPLTEFIQFKNGVNKGYWKSYCKECDKILLKQYKKLYPKEKVKQNNKRYYAKHINQVRKMQREYSRKLFKDKSRKITRKKSEKYRQLIISEVRQAVKLGKLKKPIYCRCCGRNKPLQGHHKDYSKPLDVIWLCASCHGFLHSYLQTIAERL